MIFPKKNNLSILYFLGFVLAVSVALTGYIQSSFIESFVGLQWLGIFFVGAMFVTLIAMLFFSELISRFTNYRIVLLFLILKILAIAMLVLTNSSFWLFPTFILFIVTTNLIWINMDIFIESCSSDRLTGKIRGTYFTFLNLGWVLTPLAAGYLVGNNNYRLAFIAAGLLLIPVLIIFLFKQKKLKDHCHYKHKSILYTVKKILKSWNLKGIFLISFLLHFFYTVLVIYMPIYLNQYIGFSWPTLGLIFTFMLLPFILLEYPAGIMADKYLGEKEILILGFFIIIAASALFYFTQSTNVIIWALILFMSRCGAALVESMREAYFFKIVDVKHVDFINLFRTAQPLAYVVAAGLGIFLLSIYPLRYLFIFTATILLSGIYFTLRLRDTK